MKNNHITLEQVYKIQELEHQLALFNSKRALSTIEKQLQVIKIGNCTLLFEPNSPESIYYNRIIGFSGDDIDKLDEILNLYKEQNINPGFDMVPNNINEDVALALSNRGFTVVDQLTFMEKIPQSFDVYNKAIKLVQVTEDNAEEFVKTVIQSSGGMVVDDSVINRKKDYFYRSDFQNFIAYYDGQVAGIGSLFVSGNQGYMANGFTFKKYRNKGIQKELAKQRINKAKELGLTKIYTDVEFGSISHNNMRKLVFETVYVNSFWMRVK